MIVQNAVLGKSQAQVEQMLRLISDVCLGHRPGDSPSAVELLCLNLGLVLDCDSSELPEGIRCPESNSELSLWKMDWRQGRDIGRTFSKSVPTLTAPPNPPDSLLLSAGGGADLTEGPQPPRGPQSAASRPGRPLPVLSQRVGAILPGVYHYSL